MHKNLVPAIIGAVVAVLAVYQPDAWVWALCLLWAFLFGLLNYDHHRDRAAIWNGLMRRDNALVYTKLVDSMLRWSRRALSPEDAMTDRMPSKGLISQFGWLSQPLARDTDDLRHLQANTLSWPVMEAALKLAIIYPFLLLLVQWAVSGQDTGIAGVTILPTEERTWVRAALVCPIILMLIARILASVTQMRVWQRASEWLFFSAFALALALILAGKVASASGSVGRFALALAAAAATPGALAVAGASALALTLAVASVIAGVVASVIASTLVATLALACVVALGYSCRKSKGGLSYALFVIGFWTCLVSVFAVSAEHLSAEGRMFMFAIGLLPLINAVFDYLSYGITLGLIRYGRHQRNLLTGLIWIVDGLVAVLLLIALGITLSGTIALINHLAGQEFIGLRPIFDDLKTPVGRAGYTWLTLSLLSTLVPTLVHLALVFLSAFTWVPQRFKHWIARSIGDDETGDLATLGGSAAAATLGALWAGFVALGLWGIWMFVTVYIERAGLMVLGIVENVSISLGWI